jgi:muramoyltetrapeptide carboxypeptidase
MIADDKVAAVMSSVGGRTTNGVVEHLDWDLIARRPKLLIGYSDFTVLQAAVWTETGLGGVYGPALLPQFGEPGGADPFSVEALERVVGCTEPAGLLGHPPTWATDFREWDVDDDDPRPRMPGPPLRTVRAGDAVGRLVPVNLDGLLVLAGTPWFPPLEGAVLAIEATNGTAVDGLCAGLVQLRHLGAFRRVAAVAFGRFAPPHMADDARLDGFLDEIVDGSAPVIAGLAFGHTDPMVSLPWGAGCAVRARPDSASVEILDPAVEDRR